MPNLFEIVGLEEPKKHYIPKFPSPEFNGDTWRKKTYYDSFWNHWKGGNEEKAMIELKKVHADFMISTTTPRVKARKYGLLTIDYIVSVSTDMCLSCNSPLWYGRCCNSFEGLQKDGSQQPSLDRLDPHFGRNEWHEGYINENVWIICKKCNTRKNDATSSDDLRNLADAWESELERKKWI
jgi:5-methylcytosine-specific restriction endonuclease McrA